MDHSWHQLSIATLGSGRARTRSGLAISRVDERDHCAHVLGSFLAPVCLERLPRAPTAILSAGTPDDIEACQQFGGRSGSAAADRPALFKNEPPRSRVCTLAQTRQSRLSEGHCPRRAGADPEKRIPATVASKMLDAGDAPRRRRTHHVPNDLGLPRDSRDEALDRAARNRSSANRSRGALKPVIADGCVVL